MGRSIFSIIAVGTALTLSMPAWSLAQEPVSLEPSGPWAIDYADEKCTLGRTFGSGENLHLLTFSQSSPGSAFSVTASGPRLKKFLNRKPTTVTLDGTESRQISKSGTLPFAGKTERFGPAIVYSVLSFASWQGPEAEAQPNSAKVGNEAKEARPSGIDLPFFAQWNAITFNQRRHGVKFNTGELESPMSALQTCTEDLLRHWGLDVERHLTMSRMASWENQLEIAKEIQKNYPQKALRRGESAIFRIRLIIDEAGNLAECKLDNLTVADSFNSPVCAEVSKGVFQPALDAEGKPMRSYLLTVLTYLIRDESSTAPIGSRL